MVNDQISLSIYARVGECKCEHSKRQKWPTSEYKSELQNTKIQLNHYNIWGVIFYVYRYLMNDRKMSNFRNQN